MNSNNSIRYKLNTLYILFLLLLCHFFPIMSNTQKLIPFSFANEKLIDITRKVVALDNAHVVLPQEQTARTNLEQQRITFSPTKQQLLTALQAWKLLLVFLEQSGFSLIKQDQATYVLKQLATPPSINAIAHEPLPLYVDINTDQIPQTDQYIRYIYFAKNLTIPTQQSNSSLEKALNQLKSKEAPSALFLPDVQGIILTDRARVIATIIPILKQLELNEETESIEVISLNFLSAANVVNTLNLLKKGAGKQASQSNIRLFAEELQNNIIMIGPQKQLNNLKVLIHNEIDKPLLTGDSFLHTYDLKYLDAQEVAQQLNDILKNQAPNKQAVQTYRDTYGFRGPVIIPEITQEVTPTFTTEKAQAARVTSQGNFAEVPIEGIKGKLYTGGNRLIIAAFNNDWIRIKNLIDQLDTPQPQVILELLFVDFIQEKNITFAGTTRNLTDAVDPGAVSFLSSNITNVQPAFTPGVPIPISDLLATTDPNLLTPLIEPGSLIISFNDPTSPGIFALLKLLRQTFNFKVLSHPFLYVANNQKAEIEQSEVRRANGPLVPVDGSYTVLIENVEAELKVQAVPQVANDNTVKLRIGIEISEFRGDTTARTVGLEVNEQSLDRVVRGLTTTAFIKQGETLVLGGLVRTDQTMIATQTPILGSIPLVGRFFRGDKARMTKNTVSLFVTPIIVQPKQSHIQQTYTAEKIKEGSLSQIFEPENSQDPLTKLFFTSAEKERNITYIPLTGIINNQALPQQAQSSTQVNSLKNILKHEENPLINSVIN